MHFLIGDLQGCCDAFDRLLAEVAFSPSRDSLTVLGDLVNRGPQSLAVLRRVRGLGAAAEALLGNHDLHLLAVAHGVRPVHASDTLQEILDSPERDAWLEWLRARPLALERHGWLCVHAGVNPAWTSFQTLALAAEVEALLRGPDLGAFLPQMYGNEPARWCDTLQGAERWRHVINVLTRIRFVHADDGALDFKLKENAGCRAAGPRAVVRGAGPCEQRHADRFRPLVHARPHQPSRPAGTRHRLRLGRLIDGRARRWRTARGDAGALRDVAIRAGIGQCARKSVVGPLCEFANVREYGASPVMCRAQGMGPAGAGLRMRRPAARGALRYSPWGRAAELS